VNLDEAIKMAREVLSAEATRGDMTRQRAVLARAVLAMALVVEAAGAQSRLATELDAVFPHVERERYIELHQAWINSTEATEAAVNALSKEPHGG
jgi:hypothetical protein